MFANLIKNRFFQIATFVVAGAIIIFGFNYDNNSSETAGETASVKTTEVKTTQVSNDQEVSTEAATKSDVDINDQEITTEETNVEKTDNLNQD